jgi:hypothetical protein
MAYDRNDTRDAPRDERARWSAERDRGRDRWSSNDRGFFERAGDEVASWFGDEDAERRRRQDEMMRERHYGSNFGRERGWRPAGRVDEGRGPFDWSSYRGYGGGAYQGSMWGTDMSGEPGVERGYRPMMGNSTRSDGLNLAAGYPRDYRPRASETDEYRRGPTSSGYDPHYAEWRRRELDALDRDYDEYRRENQERFENEFASWREQRTQKRGLLGQIREHMEVVGSDDQHVGTIDCIAGDRIILTKSDPESGGVHHSLSCSEIERVEGDRVMLDLPAEQAKQRWRDESRSRAFFEHEEQREMAPHMLDRSFEGTYR